MIDLIPVSLFDASAFFDWFVNNASYLMVFLFMTIESSFIPFPSEVVVPPAAYVACTNYGAGADMNIYMVVVMATLGALCGALINYFLALWVGQPVVYKFADSKFGHACMIDRAKVDKAEKYFDKHGAISTFVGRLIPVIRQLISIPAGLAKMNIGQFIIYTVLGGLIWNIILALMGFWLSKMVSIENLFGKVEEYNQYLTWCGYGLLLICVLVILWNAFGKKHKKI